MAGDKPLNILVIMADQLTAFALGCYGHKAVKSPNIDRLAERGVVFDNAYSSSPLCTPARVCFMSGQATHRTGGYDNAAYMPANIPTFAHYLRHMGYKTALSGKMHWVGPDQMHGFEERLTTDIYPADFGWTPDWTDFDARQDWWYHNLSVVKQAGVAAITNQLYFDDQTGFRAKRYLYDAARSEDDRPFCLVASFTHPHDPYAARRKYWDLYDDAEIELPSVPAIPVDEMDPHSRRLHHVSDMGAYDITERDIRNARRAYYANVSYVDDWAGDLLDALDETGLADNTAVIVCSDHGDMLGERGLWFKMSFHEWSARVPMILSAPGHFAPRRVPNACGLIDVLPTLVDLAAESGGLDAPEWIDVPDGRSLLPLAAGGGADDPDQTLAEYMGEGAISPLVMIRRGRWKFVRCRADPDQLFDLEADPLELENRAGDPAAAETLGELSAAADARWDLAAIEAEVLADQRRRRFLWQSLTKGHFTPWDYQPPDDATQQYMRNHLDLNVVERTSRWPRPE